MITTTVGRIVHYYPEQNDHRYGEAPLAAIITQVHSDTCVNLAVFNPNGQPMNDVCLTSVTLIPPREQRPWVGHFCEWMPYQVKKSTGSESGEPDAGTQAI